MKSHVIKIRRRGVELPKKYLFDRFNQPTPGELSVGESSDQGLHRTCMRAHFVRDGSTVGGDYLFDCRILWIHDQRMMLTGFEKVKSDDGEISYAQSWLCMFEPPPPMPEGR
ncbi:hypothetical protein ACO0LM_12100 [Undibacterium sp. Di26W]|uniref:hypothetical protein n=1 Tax=Undibacterium sp. Di26W TaxID=3413035 RepID=UPI003BF43612